MHNKKIFIIFLILFALGIVVGWIFFQKNPIRTGTSSNSNDLPFGGGGQIVNQNNDTGTNTINGIDSATTTTVNSPDMLLPGLYSISREPIGGITVFDTKNLTVIRYVERATGHIFEKVRGSTDTIRITNTTIPKIYEALFSSDGKEIIFRYLRDDNETIRSFYAKTSASSTPDQDISGIFLDDNMRSMSVSGQKLLAVKENQTGASILFSSMDGSKKVSIFSAPTTKWQVRSSGANTSTIYNNASGKTVGSAYMLNNSTGTYVKIGDGLGVTALANPSGKQALIARSYTNSISLSLVTVGKEEKNLELKTLPEKCVWGSDSVVYCAVPKLLSSNLYPDAWYLGEASFNDALWRMNTETGEIVLIADLGTLGKSSIDATELSINASQSTISFKNKYDLSGWIYVLK